MRPLKLAIVGCGRVTEIFHLPIAMLSDQFRVVALVDKFLPRTQQLADHYGVPVVVDDYREIVDQVDAAIVAVPHHLHAIVTLDLLQSGIHVLVEKPMALKTSDCDKMISMADKAEVVLAVGLVRRFYQASRFVKQILEVGMLGEIKSFDLREGVIFNWNAISESLFQRHEGGGGVLADIGSHSLDLLLWWLGDCNSLEYYDDARGGVEADCELYLQLQSGATGVVELSRTRNLRNSWIIYGEKGSLEIGTGFNPLIHLNVNYQDYTLTGHALQSGIADESIEDIFCRQLDDFGGAILDQREPFVPGLVGLRAVKLIETCYASKQLLQKPWMFPERPDRRVIESTL